MSLVMATVNCSIDYWSGLCHAHILSSVSNTAISITYLGFRYTLYIHLNFNSESLSDGTLDFHVFYTAIIAIVMI